MLMEARLYRLTEDRVLSGQTIKMRPTRKGTLLFPKANGRVQVNHEGRDEVARGYDEDSGYRTVVEVVPDDAPFVQVETVWVISIEPERSSAWVADADGLVTNTSVSYLRMVVPSVVQSAPVPV
jgi:hypothetical protein